MEYSTTLRYTVGQCWLFLGCLTVISDRVLRDAIQSATVGKHDDEYVSVPVTTAEEKLLKEITKVLAEL